MSALAAGARRRGDFFGAGAQSGARPSRQTSPLAPMSKRGVWSVWVQAAGEGFENRQPLALEAGQGQLLHQLIEIGNQPIPQAKAVLAR